MVADEDFRDLLVLSLEGRGFSVNAFDDAASAIQYVESNASAVGAVVVDVDLPSGEELSVCDKVVEINRRARVLVLTGDARRVHEVRSHGFRIHLKPVPMETLCAEIEPLNA